jgi:tRNA (cytidine/uridine-2'-O-)-methyltransferase
MTPEQPSSARPSLLSPVLRVVLVEPEIPNNTGNIGRTCVAAGCALELVHPLGFSVSEKACRRAGLDYWPRLRVIEHADVGRWKASLGEVRPWLFTTKAARPWSQARFERGDVVVFGKETAGLDTGLLDAFPDRCLGLPMVAGERSLNLATAVCAVVYEGIRQLLERGCLSLDAQGRLQEKKL